jgi:histone-lysine N-methyltransferase SETD2
MSSLEQIKIVIVDLQTVKKMLGATKSLNSIVFRSGRFSVRSQNQYVKKKKRKTKCENCIGQFLRLWHPRQKM